MMVKCPDCERGLVDLFVKCPVCYGTGWIKDPEESEKCTWVLAQPPEGIAPAAFSWWDCTNSRRYGIPISSKDSTERICDKCHKKIHI